MDTLIIQARSITVINDIPTTPIHNVDDSQSVAVNNSTINPTMAITRNAAPTAIFTVKSHLHAIKGYLFFASIEFVSVASY